MGTRLDLQHEFEELMGSKNVYYQPPESKKLSYPCIVYSRTPGLYRRADNLVYSSKNRYDVLVIHRDPDADYIERMMTMPYCSYDRRYIADGLYHDAFRLFY